MRAVLAVMAASVCLSGCGKAAAAVPDSRNPAHCIAAYAYGEYKFKSVNNTKELTELMARSAFELRKAVASGKSQSDVISEAHSFTTSFISEKNKDKIGDLFIACGHAEDNDPRFRAEIGGILSEVRSRYAAGATGL
jgi:hypothetical protein